MDFYTFGGITFWQDVAVASGWKVQKNLLWDSYRLLDNNNICRHRGERKDCIHAMQKYLRDWEVEDDAEELTFILGSLFRTRLCFDSVAKALTKAGIPSYYINCSPVFTGPVECSWNLTNILSSLPPSVKKINFVTFGIGGLILRQMLSLPAIWQNKVKIDKIVMVAVPNHGSVKVKKLRKNPLTHILMGRASFIMLPEEAEKLHPIPKELKVGLIYGNPYNKETVDESDGIIYVTETYIDNAKRRTGFNLGHYSIMNNEKTILCIINYLKFGLLSYKERTTSKPLTIDLEKPNEY